MLAGTGQTVTRTRPRNTLSARSRPDAARVDQTAHEGAPWKANPVERITGVTAKAKRSNAMDGSDGFDGFSVRATIQIATPE